MKTERKLSLLSKLALMLFGAASMQTVVAQDQDTVARPEVVLEEIVVKGIRKSIIDAQILKRDSDVLIDAISAEDLGKFPDENVAESLQRITGVQITRLRGEGQRVNIRGLPSELIRVQFNGHTLPSGLRNAEQNATRNFDFTVLPSEFVRTLEVYKSPSADLEEGGLAGSVVLRTPRPFDFDERQISFSVQSAWNSNSDEFSPRASGLFSDTYANGKFGITLGGAYSKRKPETHQLDFRGFDPRSEMNGFSASGGPVDFNSDGDFADTIGIPFLVFYNIFEEQRERISGLGSFQLLPFNDVGLELRADVFYTRLDVEAIRNANLYFPRNATGPVIAAGTTINNNRAEVLQSDGVDLRGGSRFEDRIAETISVAFGGTLSSGPWTVDAEFAYSKSDQNGDDLNIATQARGLVTTDALSDSDVISITNDGPFDQARLDPTSFRLLSLNGEFQRQDENERFDFRFDVDRDVNLSILNSVEFGTKYSTNTEFHDQGRLVVVASEIDGLVGDLPAFPGGGFSAAPFMEIKESSSGSFLGAYSGSGTFPQQWLGSDTKEFLSGFTDDELITAGTFTNAPVGIINVEEDIFAAYVKANFGDGEGIVSGNLGVRVVHTSQSSVGVTPDLTGIVQFPDAGEVTIVPPAGEISVDRSYTEVLPSVNFKINVTEDVVARFGASRTMSRAPLGQLSPSTTANGMLSEINQQNPFLDPFVSNNIDASAEWYFGDGNLLSLAFFYKDIESLVRLDTETITLPITLQFADGTMTVENRDFQRTSPINGEGVVVKGLEFGYQQQFDFLPAPFDALGVAGNYTFIHNSDTNQLTGSSRHNYNIGGYYENDRLGIRLSYTWRDDFLLDPNSGFGDGVTVLARGGLDGNITYNVNDNFDVVVEAINITDTADRSRFRSGIANEFTDTGRRILLGVRGNF